MSSRGERSDEEDVLELIGVNENQDSNHGSGDELQGDQDQVQEFHTQNSGDENAGNVGQKVTPKVPKRARSSVPRLTTELLKGPKGVHTIEKYYEGFKFYGKGREKEDLIRIMKRLEHWSHRLFPKLNFDDCLDKFEKLGTKKDLQVFLKRYRTDMITADEDLMRPELVDDDDDDDNVRQENSTPQEEFDLMLAEQIEKQRHNTTMDSAFDNLLASVNSPTTKKKPESELSDEVKERIERNRKLAIERKLATMKRLQELKTAKDVDDNQIASTSDVNRDQPSTSYSSQQVTDTVKSIYEENNSTQKSFDIEESTLDKRYNVEGMEEDAEPITSDNADKNMKITSQNNENEIHASTSITDNDISEKMEEDIPSYSAISENKNSVSQGRDEDEETKAKMEEAETNFLQNIE